MRTPTSKMKTPVVKKQRLRSTRAKGPEINLESTGYALGDEDGAMDDGLSSDTLHQAHSFPMELDGDGFDPNDRDDRKGRSQSIPFRSANEDAKSHNFNPSHEDEGIRLMGLEVSLLQDAIADLRRLGVDHVIPLPELVVVGDQSAGKSSLIGGLAEIHLPRSAGTCTRCPTFIKTASAKTQDSRWTCKVTLQKTFTYAPGHKGKLGPWKECEPEESDFAIITDKTELDEVLKWAQIAILNPSKDPKNYAAQLGNNPDSSYEVKFSPNLISLEISGPRLPSLSFYDLPGIIQNADESHLVELVKKLVQYYIGRRDALILCAMPMSSDPANSAAIHQVRRSKAENRCIGVLTKPDLLQDGELDDVWLPLLHGQKDGFKLGHGYFVTKQPFYTGTEQLKDHIEARDEEEAFFNRAPWSTDLKEFEGVCGTKRLQRALSQLLAYQIKSRLPSITNAIERKALEIDSQLAKLPELPDGDAQGAVIQMLSTFSAEVEKKIGGGPDYNEFQQIWKELRSEFREKISSMEPLVTLYDPETERTSIPPPPHPKNGLPGTPTRGPRTSSIIDLDPDDNDTRTEALRPKIPKQEPETPTFTHRASPFSIPQKRRGSESPSGRSPKRVFEGGHSAACKSRSFALRDIRRIIQRISSGNFPGETDPQVTTDLSKKAVEPWKAPLEILTRDTLTLAFTTISETLAEVLSGFAKTALYTQAMDQIHVFFNNIETHQRERVESLLKVELEEPMTLNERVFNEHKIKSLENVQQHRHNLRVKTYLDRQENRSQKFTYFEARKSKATKVTSEELGPDPFYTEVVVISKVKGYYLTAYPRFVDNISVSFQAQMFREIKTTIRSYLENALGVYGVNGNDRCRRLLDEHPEVAAHRKRLQAEKEKLNRASERLRQLAEDGRTYFQEPELDQSDYLV